jgi:hypothetical protein
MFLIILYNYLAKFLSLFQPASVTNNNILCLFYISELSLNYTQAYKGNEIKWNIRTANCSNAILHFCVTGLETVRNRSSYRKKMSILCTQNCVHTPTHANTRTHGTVYTQNCVHTRTNANTRTHRTGYTQNCVHTKLRTHTYTRKHTYTRNWVHTKLRKHTYTHAYTRTHTHARTELGHNSQYKFHVDAPSKSSPVRQGLQDMANLSDAHFYHISLKVSQKAQNVGSVH